MKFFFTILFLFIIQVQYAQNRQHATNNSLWMAYSGNHKITEKFGFYIEFQERRNNFGQTDMQHFFRTALNYYVLPNIFFSAGYAFAQIYPYGEFKANAPFPEHRIYQQLQYATNLESVEAVSRFRLEQRFLFQPTTVVDGHFYASDTATYTNRVRYLNKFSVPFKGKTIGDKSFYFTISDEIFINFGENVKKNIFDQNRMFIGLGYKIPKIGRIECGYLQQTAFKGDGIKVEDNQTLSIAFNCNADWFKIKKK